MTITKKYRKINRKNRKTKLNRRRKPIHNKTQKGKGPPLQINNLNPPTSATPKINCTLIPSPLILSNFLEQLRYKTYRLDNKDDVLRGCTQTIGRGTYNYVCASTLGPMCNEVNHPVIIRTSSTPFNRQTIRKSVENALLMSDLKLSPRIYNIQLTKDEHVIYVMEKYNQHLRTYLESQQSVVNKTNIIKTLQLQTKRILHTMASVEMLCIDIKPLNTVVNIDSDNLPIIRFIDFDAEHCYYQDMHASLLVYIDQWHHHDNSTLQVMYKLMIIIFANHLYKINFNYLYTLVKSEFTEKDFTNIESIIQDNANLLKTVMNYFPEISNIGPTAFVRRATLFKKDV